VIGGGVNIWPADRVERRSIAALIPSARNARTHSDAQVAQIAASIREWGWTVPAIVDDEGNLIAGHGRILAARKLGLTEIPVAVAEGWSEAKKRAYALADNKLALNAGWDDDLLRLELGALRDDGFNLDLTGFDADELASILVDRTQGLTDPDDAPAVPEQAVSKLGDVWLLGRHRLCCGDATNEVDVSHALGGVRPHLMVTDPPYGVEYDADWRNRVDRANGKAYGARATGAVTNDDRADWSDAWALFPGDVAYCWAPPGADQFRHYEALVTAGFEMRMQIIWAKSHFPIGRGNYHVQHEPCWYAVRSGKTAHWAGDRKQTTLWHIDKPVKSETGHSTQKPVECMKRPIENNSSPGQAVYDPFCGSGTTIIAAEMTGRACHAIEIAPQYVDVAVQRWQAFTGDAATLYGTDKTFAAVAAERMSVAETS
jgi:DNA modification methylase